MMSLWTLLFVTHCPREEQAVAFQRGDLGFQKAQTVRQAGTTDGGRLGAARGLGPQDTNASPPPPERSKLMAERDRPEVSV